ncbi:Outer membrane usher protein FimD precursor [compost metagenome]
MTLLRAGGQPVPFGATVTVADNKESQGFIVGDGGQVYLTGLSDSGVLQVKWGNSLDEQCRVDYSIPNKTNGIVNVRGL